MNLSCEICDKIFNGPDPYQDHMHSQRHAKKVKQLSNDKNTPNDKIAKIFSDEFMIRHETGFKCILCNVLVNSFKQGEGHIIGRKHQNALFAKNLIMNSAKAISDNTVSSNSQENDGVVLSCKNISGTVTCENKTENESKLLTNLNFQSIQLKVNKDISDHKSEKSADEIKCTLCDLVLNSTHQLRSHVDGRKHKNRLVSKGLVSSSEVSSTSDTPNKTIEANSELETSESVQMKASMPDLEVTSSYDPVSDLA